MSIEAALQALTEAVAENTATLKSISGAVKNQAKAGATAGTTKADEDEDKPKRTRASSTKTKAITAKDLAQKTTAFLEVEDEEEYDRRKVLIKKIVGKFDVAKMSEVAEEDRAEANELLEACIAGKNPFARRRDEDDDVA